MAFGKITPEERTQLKREAVQDGFMILGGVIANRLGKKYIEDPVLRTLVGSYGGRILGKYLTYLVL